MFWVIEQPCGSSLWNYPRLKVFLSKVEVFRHSLAMFDFGGDTQKQTWLWSNKDFIGGVDQFSVRRERGVTKDLVEVWDVGGKRKFRGNDETKSSQTYPVPFGEAIAKLFIKHGDALQQDARSWHRHVSDKLDRSDVAVLLPTIVSQSQGGWQDAMLDDVFAYLERQHV